MTLKKALETGYRYKGRYYSSSNMVATTGRVDLVKQDGNSFKFLSFWRTISYLKKVFPNQFYHD